MNHPEDRNPPPTYTLKLTPAHLGQRLDVVLAQLLPQISRSKLQQWCELGAVSQAGLALGANYKIKKVLPLAVVAQADASLDAFTAEDIVLDRIFEDDHLTIIHKPVGLVVHPGANNWTGTLMNGLLYHYPASSSLPRAGIVHRLDRDTSGLMVVAKTSTAYNALVAALKARTVSRRYVAVAHGVPVWNTRRIDLPIARDPKLRTRMAVALGTVARPSMGKTATTDVRVLASQRGLGASLVECKLHTGRTHQIRVHLSHQGHALLGDATYGGKPLLGMQRQALHAWKLGFTHPVTGQYLEHTSAPPEDFLGALSAMQLDWHKVSQALQAAPDFTAEDSVSVPQTKAGESIYAYASGEDDEDDAEDDDFDESGVEVIYVRD